MWHRAPNGHALLSRYRSIVLAGFILVPALIAGAPRAQAHGDVRGLLAPAAYGGQLMIGSLNWWDTKNALLAGSSAIADPRAQSTRDLYVSTGLYYGVGPNTLVGFYLPYDALSRLEHDQVTSTRKGLGLTQLIVQQRLLRLDGTRSRTEVAIAARGFFLSPGKPAFPQWRPSNYRLVAGAQHSGWRDLATASVGYTGAGYDPSFAANWTINGSYSRRPTTAWMASGRDLSLGLESNFKISATGKSRRLLLGPMVEIYPAASLSIAASLGWPVYERITPKGLGGGSSLWLSTYLLY